MDSPTLTSAFDACRVPIPQMRRLSTSPILLCIAIGACTPSGDNGGTAPGTISNSISPTSATVPQAGYQPVTATITRTGSFFGNIHFAVTGLPSGATASVSNSQTIDGITTALVSIFVEMSTAPGVYTVAIRATGDGTGTATAQFTLTVVAAVPGYTMTMSSTALTTNAGSDPTASIALSRTLFTSGITLSVDNLPDGVTASFSPASTITGGSATMTLVVTPTAVLPLSIPLTLRGTADGLADRTVAFTLASTGYLLQMASTSLSTSQGQSVGTTVTVSRANFTGSITFSVVNLPAGVTAAFTPNNTSGNSTSLQLNVSGSATPGTFTNLLLRGVATGLPDVTAPFSLTVGMSPPAYTMQLSPTPISGNQGQSSGSTVILNRTNFSGSVNLTVENLPAGVTATISPNNLTGSNTFMTLHIGVSSPVGTFSNVVLRGVAAGLPDRTVTFTLIVSAPPFTIDLSLSSVSIARGTVGPPIAVTIVRNTFFGSIPLYFDDGFYYLLPAGLSAVFTPNPALGTSAVLTVGASAVTVPGVYYLYAYGFTGVHVDYAPLVVTITP